MATLPFLSLLVFLLCVADIEVWREEDGVSSNDSNLNEEYFLFHGLGTLHDVLKWARGVLLSISVGLLIVSD
jgi:hypothetical protein